MVFSKASSLCDWDGLVTEVLVHLLHLLWKVMILRDWAEMVKEVLVLLVHLHNAHVHTDHDAVHEKKSKKFALELHSKDGRPVWEEVQMRPGRGGMIVVVRRVLCVVGNGRCRLP